MLRVLCGYRSLFIFVGFLVPEVLNQRCDSLGFSRLAFFISDGIYSWDLWQWVGQTFKEVDELLVLVNGALTGISSAFV